MGATWQIAEGQSRQSSDRPVGAEQTSSTRALASASPDPNAPRASLVVPGARVLFQGDSITDAGRDRGAVGPNTRPAMGAGYAWLAASGYLTDRPQHRLRFFNKGVSGDTTADLARRWSADTLAVNPDVVSILVGVNDYWNRHRVLGFTGSPEAYHRDLETLIGMTRGALPETAIVICEPFLLEAGPVKKSWQRDFGGYRQAAADLAVAHDLRFVGFQSVLDAALEWAPASAWCHDGIHPTSDGAALLAREWVRVAGQ